ncbi:leucine--tRNA ligase [Candidatus Parcubacteria bacterium]|nr:leucine--tRNA ligase [Candidatus Parcubacteria bacterium]
MHWDKMGIYEAKDDSAKEKLFLLVEFPYPSGAGLHVGHCRSYTAFDVIARKQRMQGKNVLYPIGWDAFGLPSENYAIKTGIHPAITTKQSIATFTKQLKSMGFSFDWQREINTTDPNYYKWTQWIFLKLFENSLAYKAKIPINWCLSCKIGLANEEVVDGACERCGGAIEKREKEQWLIKITKYADKLIDGLKLVDFPERVKAQQINWIGKSCGYEIEFPIVILNGVKNLKIKVFTTRLDTIFSGTFLILAPEHPFIEKNKDRIINFKEILAYKEKSKKISEIDRENQEREVSGVALEGVLALNPATNEKMPVWIADFVLANYGTGAVFADAHDLRDFKMAKKYNLPLKVSILPDDEKLAQKVRDLEECYEGEGILFNSKEFDGLTSQEARQAIGDFLKDKGLAKEKINYKLRDWVFSRQRYWGEPIPLINCEKCGWVALKESDLPLELPNVKNYKPTDTGESPLSAVEKWVNVKCPKCKGKAKRETDVMPNWAGSNWYYLAYLMPRVQSSKCKVQSEYKWDQKRIKYWMPVDWYNGGMEHTTLHLLYSRFIYKFLWDIGAVPKEIGPEPYKKRTSHGMILAEGGVKMSKSKGNVINPDDVVEQYGADTLRVYEMFMGPFGQAIAWDTNSIKGARRFLDRAFHLQFKVQSSKLKVAVESSKLKKILHKTIKKVSEDIDQMKFNTAVSALMECLNAFEKEENLKTEDYLVFITLLSPFAPHLVEELWQQTGKKTSIFLESWPLAEEKWLFEDKVDIIVQINGKVRGKIEADNDVSEKEAKELALKDENIAKWLLNKPIKKVVFVKNKLINFVI